MPDWDKVKNSVCQKGDNLISLLLLFYFFSPLFIWPILTPVSAGDIPIIPSLLFLTGILFGFILMKCQPYRLRAIQIIVLIFLTLATFYNLALRDLWEHLKVDALDVLITSIGVYFLFYYGYCLGAGLQYVFWQYNYLKSLPSSERKKVAFILGRVVDHPILLLPAIVCLGYPYVVIVVYYLLKGRLDKIELGNLINASLLITFSILFIIGTLSYFREKRKARR